MEEVKEAIEQVEDNQHEFMDKAQALAEAQGQQSNEISRYLHELGEVMDSNRKDHYNELLTLHEDIGRIRDQLSRPPPNPQTEVKIIAPAEEKSPLPPPKDIAPMSVGTPQKKIHRKVVPVMPTALGSPVPPAATVVVNNAPPVVASPAPIVAPVATQDIPAATMTISEHSDHGSPAKTSK